jgi:hypothetical protein
MSCTMTTNAADLFATSLPDVIFQKTSVNVYHSTRCDILEDKNIHNDNGENIRSRNSFTARWQYKYVLQNRVKLRTLVCVYVWLYVCIYVRMYVCIYVRTHVCMYARTHVLCIYVRTHVFMYGCTYIGTHYVCMYVCIMYVCTQYVCRYACMYVFMYACMYVRMYICMYYVCTHVCMHICISQFIPPLDQRFLCVCVFPTVHVATVLLLAGQLSKWRLRNFTEYQGKTERLLHPN